MRNSLIICDLHTAAMQLRWKLSWPSRLRNLSGMLHCSLPELMARVWWNVRSKWLSGIIALMAIMCFSVNVLSMFNERLKMIERFGKYIFQKTKIGELNIGWHAYIKLLQRSLWLIVMAQKSVNYHTGYVTIIYI